MFDIPSAQKVNAGLTRDFATSRSIISPGLAEVSILPQATC